MKRTLLTLLLLATACLANAQRPQPHKVRGWDDGRLTFDDFRGRPSLSTEGSFAELQLGATTAYDTADGIVIPYPVARATMQRYHSWMLPSCRNASRLRYHQLQFDLLEAERRRLQQSLLYTYQDEGLLLDSAFARYGRLLDSLQATTADGTDTAALGRWEESLSQTLTALPEGRRLHFRRPFLFEMGFGMGMQLYTGTLDKDFSHGFSMDLMLNLLWCRHMVAFDLGLGVLSARDTVWNLDENDYFYTNLPVSHIHGLLEYGYRVVDRNRWSLTPFVGVGFHRLDQSEDEVTFGSTTGTVAAGLLLEYRSLMSFDILGSGVAERYDLDFTAKVTVTRSEFGSIDGSPSGYGIYLQLGAALGWGRYIVE